MRAILFDMATKAGIMSEKLWIPCFGARSCFPFSLPDLQNFEVYGGHLNFMHMTNIMRELHNDMLLHETKTQILENGEELTHHTLDDSYRHFDCVTTIRPTVKRAISCWNYRFNNNRGDLPKALGFPLPRSNKLAAQDFATFLPETYDQYGNGCNNELARIFGSTVDETHVNTLSLSEPGFVQELDKIASRISKCIILHSDRCEDSNKIIEHFIPWMNGTDMCSRHKNSFGKSSDEVSEEAKAVILEQNYIDELIFNLGEELFEKQLEKATSP